MDYDLTKLGKLGAEQERLRTALEDVRAKLRKEILAAHAAGARQVDIAKNARYTRDAIYKMTQAAERDETKPHPS